MKRLNQIILIGCLLGFCWLGMQAVHEFGHVLGAWTTGGKVAQVVLHPFTISGSPKVVYRAEKADCQPFPILGDERLFRGISRDFEVFDPLEFLAACRAVASERRRKTTQHIPDPAIQMIRYSSMLTPTGS